MTKNTLGGALFTIGVVLAILFFLLAPRSLLRTTLVGFIGEDFMYFLSIFSDILGSILLVAGYAVLESSRKPRGSGVQLVAGILILPTSLVIAGVISYLYSAWSKMVLLAIIIYIPAYTVFYFVSSRWVGRKKVSEGVTISKIYFYTKEGGIVELIEEELPSELRERLESVLGEIARRNAELVKRVKPGLQWCEILLLTVVLFITIYALILGLTT